MNIRNHALDASSLASVMRAITNLGVTYDDSVKIRKRAINLAKQDTRIRNVASVATVFWGSLRQGLTAADVLKSDSRAVLRLARDLENEIYGHAPQHR